MPEADEIRLSAIFEPISFRSTSTKFRGGSVECWYGGGAVDLRDAVVDPAGAQLRVRAIFGGGQILVPETWQVAARVRGIGCLADTRPQVERGPDAPHLTIEGIVVFGGFAVMSEMPEAQAKGLERAVAQRRHRWPRVGLSTEPAA